MYIFSRTLECTRFLLKQLNVQDFSLEHFNVPEKILYIQLFQQKSCTFKCSRENVH